MDHRRTLAAFLILMGSAAAAAGPLDQLAEARWTRPEAGVAAQVEALTRLPGECLALPADPEQRRLVALGRAAFRSPLILGGQAGRVGLSCASCHRNGRGNPDFTFPGLSGAPGTADVTSSLMSRSRGDGVFNPKPIPDLARDPPRVARADLSTFVRGLVVEEFDGPEPDPRVLAGLVAYVGALSPDACSPDVARTAGHALGEVMLALVAARDAAMRGEAGAARAALGSARSQLGLIAERYAGNAKVERGLAQVDDQLAALAAGGADGSGFDTAERTLAALRPLLRRGERHSLYNPARLRAGR